MPYRVSTSIAQRAARQLRPRRLPPWPETRRRVVLGNPYKLGVIGSSDTHVAAGIFRGGRLHGALRVGAVRPLISAARLPLDGRWTIKPAADAHGPRTTAAVAPMGSPPPSTNGGSGLAGVLGGGEHARVDLLRDAPQGDLRDLGSAHPGAASSAARTLASPSTWTTPELVAATPTAAGCRWVEISTSESPAWLQHRAFLFAGDARPDGGAAGSSPDRQGLVWWAMLLRNVCTT